MKIVGDVLYIGGEEFKCKLTTKKRGVYAVELCASAIFDDYEGWFVLDSPIIDRALPNAIVVDRVDLVRIYNILDKKNDWSVEIERD